MKSKKFLKPLELFDKISTKSGYSDPSIVADVYYGMVKAIVEELRAGNTVRLPELGDLFVQNKKSMATYMFHTGGIMKRNNVKMVKFSACANIGKYFNALRDDSAENI